MSLDHTIGKYPEFIEQFIFQRQIKTKLVDSLRQASLQECK